MFRFAIESGIGFVKRGFSSLKNGIFVGVRPAPSIQNAVLPSYVANHEVPNFRNFVFAHWLQNATRVARFKCNPIQRVVANRRNPTPLFLAFVGFSYIGAADAKNSAPCSPKEEQLHTWLQDMLQDTAKNIPEKNVNHSGKKLKDYKICMRLGKPSSNSAVYAAKVDNNQYALKMLFNFYTNSQSVSLNKAFCKELAVLSNNKNMLIRKDVSRYTKLPNHFNVMKILWHFADDIPELPDAMDSYPYALPSRLFHDGYGRNRTLFFVMPKFSGTLQEYLAEHSEDLSTRKSLALLAQLLEALRHLNKNGVVHRDLKNDNVLVNENTRPDGLPHLVLTDFDCCLAEKCLGLEMPYETDETRIWGNPELMAPEVACAEPGPGRKINYSKSDEWAAGALAYEMFGWKHPFQNQNVDKKSYHINDLPELKGAPKAAQVLVKQLLQRHPNDRPDISLAATVSQMLLWAPGLCDLRNEHSCLLEKVKRWYEEQLFSLMLEILECKVQEDIPIEKQILFTFLSHTSVEEIMDAIEWLHDAFNNDM